MTKIRVLLFLSTILIVGVVGLFVSYYARGYKFNFQSFQFEPNGILVLKSEPDGASVFVNGELKTATNATISLNPGVYDIEIRKDGFFSWYKRLTIEKEIVTQATASLFKNAPSLSPITFSGAVNPVASEDGTKIAFVVPPSKDVGSDKTGLYTIEAFNLPLGFAGGAKKVADGDLTHSTYFFSPDGKQIMLTLSNSVYLIDSTSFTKQNELVNVAARKDSIISEWNAERASKNLSSLRGLPPELTDILTRKASKFIFSPDSEMVLYTASSSGTLPENLIKPLPGASTQKQERTISQDHTYIYDIKEDRNFLISTNKNASIRFMQSSRHLLSAEEGQVVILDYDGTNRQVVYTGSYQAPFAFPYSNASKLIMLTNFGSASSPSNLYILTVK